MGKELDCEDMHETTLNKFDGLSVDQGVHEDGDGGVDDAAASSEEDGEQDATSESEDSDDDDTVPWGQRAVQVLSLRANFPISTINGYDWVWGRYIYYGQREGEAVQKEGMVDLIPIGPQSSLMAYGCFSLEIYPSTTPSGEEGSSRVGSPIKKDRDRITAGWDVCGGFDNDDEPKAYTRTICCGGSGRKLEVTYLVIPSAMEANVEVRFKFKDLSCRRGSVYGKIKASSTDYGNKSVHLFNCEQQGGVSIPSGSSWILPLSPSVIALPSLPKGRKLEFQLEVDLAVVTITDNQEEEKKAKYTVFKFTGLEFSHKVRSQEREVDGIQFEVNVTWMQITAM